MQEVTVRPRSTFRHFVTVETVGKELVWNFGTKRRNISFGLFKEAEVNVNVNPLNTNANVNANANNLNIPSASTSTNISTASEIKQRRISAAPFLSLRRRATSATPSAEPQPPTTAIATGNVAAIIGSNAKEKEKFAERERERERERNSEIEWENASPTPTVITAGSVEKHGANGFNGVNSTGGNGSALNLVELLPIAHYDSSRLTVKGSYLITVPGTYVLVFDNSFSVNTSKSLFFFVALRDPTTTLSLALPLAGPHSTPLANSPSPPSAAPPSASALVLTLAPSPPLPATSPDSSNTLTPKNVSGWILKKGDRKMQGYLKRWLIIDAAGYLSYSKSQNGPPRAVVSLNSTAVRLDYDNFGIDIDTGSAIFHLKAQNLQDFQMWVSALQSHSAAPKFSNYPLLRGASGFSNFSSSQIDEAVGNSTTNRDFGNEINDLKKQIEKDLSFLWEKSSRIKELAESHDTFTVSDLSADLCKTITELQAHFQKLSDAESTKHAKTILALDQLESAYQLCLADNNSVRSQHSLPQADESIFFRSTLRTSGTAFRSPSAINRPLSMAASLHESVKSGSIQFYDAVEYDSDENSDNESDAVVTAGSRREFDGLENEWAKKNSLFFGIGKSHAANFAPAEIHVIEQEDEYDVEENFKRGDDDEDSGHEDRMTIKSVPINYNAIVQNNDSNIDDSCNDGLDEDIETVVGVNATTSTVVVRRTMLPAPPVSMENISVLSILRNNVGKDLSTIAMPIALNEPLNLLQKLAEELEYCELLEAAADAKSVVDRMVLMSAFAISGYASTVHRAGRKPFNPLLGETYECIRPDKGFKFIAEKVSHHPPVMSCFAESPKYTFYQDNLVKSKFWGKSMELVPSGTVNVTFPEKKDHLQWSKVTTCMRNVFSGTRYLEHYGTMTISSLSTGYTSIITFKESGYFSSAKNEVSAVVFDNRGTEVAWMSGKWDEALYRFEKSSPNNLQVVWRATPFPTNHTQMYGFTQFAVELNELTPDITPLLPITDTRFRTDQRWYEDGRIADAEAEKLRLEAKQRETRRRMEAAQVVWRPRWFEEVSAGEWQYKKGYFEKRGAFTDIESIF
ncbi:Oxysterol-binding protein- protein 3 [Physocladia obscura]|uniref:Oxysterol-binding protein- protein 3 n=1 Tax=Physocladia obscura TaxID=109957 RepID=A0AAD5T873_9FUNG|nr:Oxysterol-binding protein- protein 3 [Physocladia obscura]